jgi:hypothetical protein
LCSLTSVRDLLHATKSMYVKTVVLLNVDKLVVDSGDAAAAAVPEESGMGSFTGFTEHQLLSTEGARCRT